MDRVWSRMQPKQSRSAVKWRVVWGKRMLWLFKLLLITLWWNCSIYLPISFKTYFNNIIHYSCRNCSFSSIVDDSFLFICSNNSWHFGIFNRFLMLIMWSRQMFFGCIIYSFVSHCNFSRFVQSIYRNVFRFGWRSIKRFVGNDKRWIYLFLELIFHLFYLHWI